MKWRDVKGAESLYAVSDEGDVFSKSTQRVMKQYKNNSGYMCVHIKGKAKTVHRHHCLHGSRRKAADKYDLTVYLCPECHQRLHDQGIGDRYLQQLAQKHFEDRFGHKMYMKVFGKNYL